MSIVAYRLVPRLVVAVVLGVTVDAAPAQPPDAAGKGASDRAAVGKAGAGDDVAKQAAADKGSIDVTKNDFATRVERDAVYRYDLLLQKLLPVPAKERKAGHVYYRFHPGRGRHVWSIATADGGFRYAFGPGSVQQTRQFDLRASPEERQRQLQARAPELARLLEIQGSLPTVRLGADDRWELNAGPSVTSVFDLDTGRRWEWHGTEPVGVIHSGGPRWRAAEKDYLPVDPISPPVLPVGAAACVCP
jgi:hypothetical protein